MSALQDASHPCFDFDDIVVDGERDLAHQQPMETMHLFGVPACTPGPDNAQKGITLEPNHWDSQGRNRGNRERALMAGDSVPMPCRPCVPQTASLG